MAKKKKEESVEVNNTVQETVKTDNNITKSPVRSKVTVRPIKTNGWLPTDHDGFTRYSKCFERLTVQMDRQTQLLNTGLTEEEERRIEAAMKLSPGTLSRYNKDYWATFYIDVPKTGKVLDLNLPSHELQYKVLKAHQRVANSEIERYDTPFAEYVMSDKNEEAKARNEKSKTRRKAYNLFSSLSTSDMLNVLKVYGKKVDDSSTPDFIESEVDKLVEENPQGFIDLVKDSDFKMKVFVEDCIRARVITKTGTKYALTGGDVIGYSLGETITYLSDPKNQDVYMSLKSRLDITK
jgi:hypothetical protein